MQTKTNLRIDWATHEAAKYACENWHYSKCLPAGKLVKFGVWENSRFIGVVVFSGGPSPNIWKTYNLSPIEGSELSRVALTIHITPVSRIVAIAIKLFRRYCPGIKLIISYADINMGHHGGIYQAGNWIYLGEGGPKVKRLYRGKVIHERNMSQRIIDGKNSRDEFTEEAILPKHKYGVAFDKSLALRLKKESVNYPKRAGSKANVAPVDQTGEGGVTPTPALQLNDLQTV